MSQAMERFRDGGSMRQQEKRILDKIIGDGYYDSRIRPNGINVSKDSDGPCIVKINIFLRSISRISDLDTEYSVQMTFREEWDDERLRYNDLSGKIVYLTLTDPDRIWKPDLFFRNEKDGHFHNIIVPNVLLRIHPDGHVLYSIRISLVLSCPMDLKYYPLDQQTCSISMASYGYTTEDLVFLWKEGDPVQVTDPLHLPRFTLQRTTTGSCSSKTNTGEYSCLIVNLTFKREFSYYLIQIYIPCCMLVIVSWVSFWLDPNAIPARVSLGVTTLLTMATQISGINASLPPVSYTKAIDVWTGSCLTFVFGALLEFALVNYASRCDCHRVAAEKMFLAHQLVQQQERCEEDPPLPLTRHPRHRHSQASTHRSSLRSEAGRSARASAHSWDNGLDNLNQHPTSSESAQHGTNFATRTFAGRGWNGRSPSVPESVFGNLSSPATATSGPDFFQQAATISASSTASTVADLINQKQSCCKRWLAKFPTRSKRIDVISRIFFPVMFALFNVIYWVTYLWRDDE